MFDKINFKSYEIAETILLCTIIIPILILIYLIIYNCIVNSPEKIKRKYIDKGYNEEIVIIENNNTKEILIKNNNELVDAIKKEIVEKEVAK